MIKLTDGMCILVMRTIMLIIITESLPKKKSI